MPLAVAVAVCVVVYAHARDSLYTQGGQGIESASAGGGVTSTYNSNKNVVVKLLLYRRDFGSMNLHIKTQELELGGRGGANGCKKSPKNFLVKTLDIVAGRVYTGYRKRRKGEKRTLGVTKQIRGIVNTMYIGHCCSL